MLSRDRGRDAWDPGREEDDVTSHSALKRAVRERAASHGEKYTEARRALLAAGGGSSPEAAIAEFDRQAATLLDRGYPGAAGLSASEFMRRLEPLREASTGLDAVSDLETGRFGFVIVVRGELVPSSTSIELVRRRGRAGFLSMLTPQELETFQPIEQILLPHGAAYLMTDVESGKDNRNVTPIDALATIHARRRSPLTIDEGIALITQFPEAVATYGGFSLAGSRCGDRRVSALWISKAAPKLGWCWAGNPHTWLGTASCGARIGTDELGRRC
jgi:hypothetical protein